jgi:RNA polymerase sigma-70 factor (ECF subfamily)
MIMPATELSSVLAEQISAARGGSREALGQALDLCRTHLLEVARRSLAPALRAKGTPSDLVQETFLEAQQLFPRFEGGSEVQLRAWLRCLLLHKAAKLGRRYNGTRKRQLSREIPLGNEGRATMRPSQIADTTPTPSVQVMADEQMRRLQDAISRLPDDYRRVMTLRYHEGLTFEEVGRRVARSADAARMMWARAVARLKQELQHDGQPR